MNCYNCFKGKLDEDLIKVTSEKSHTFKFLCKECYREQNKNSRILVSFCDGKVTHHNVLNIKDGNPVIEELEKDD